MKRENLMIEMMVLLMNDRYGLIILCFSYWDVICRLWLFFYVGICVIISLVFLCLIVIVYGFWVLCLRMYDLGCSYVFGFCLLFCLLFYIWYRVGYGYIFKIYDDVFLIKERILICLIVRRIVMLI